MGRGPVGSWLVGPKATILGKPVLKTSPGGYHSGEIMFLRSKKDAQRHEEQFAPDVALISLTRGLFMQKQFVVPPEKNVRNFPILADEFNGHSHLTWDPAGCLGPAGPRLGPGPGVQPGAPGLAWAPGPAWALGLA